MLNQIMSFHVFHFMISVLCVLIFKICSSIIYPILSSSPETLIHLAVCHSILFLFVLLKLVQTFDTKIQLVRTSLYFQSFFSTTQKERDEAIRSNKNTKNKNLSKNDLKKGARRRLETTTSKTVSALHSVLKKKNRT